MRTIKMLGVILALAVTVPSVPAKAVGLSSPVSSVTLYEEDVASTLELTATTVELISANTDARNLLTKYQSPEVLSVAEGRSRSSASTNLMAPFKLQKLQVKYISYKDLKQGSAALLKRPGWYSSKLTTV